MLVTPQQGTPKKKKEEGIHRYVYEATTEGAKVAFIVHNEALEDREAAIPVDQQSTVVNTDTSLKAKKKNYCHIAQDQKNIKIFSPSVLLQRNV
jgi:hypothetical protein